MSNALSRIAKLSVSSVSQEKLTLPRPIGLTDNPVRPNLRYSMCFLVLDERTARAVRSNASARDGEFRSGLSRNTRVAHHARFAVIERPRAMQHAAVVPHDDVAGAPGMFVRARRLARE